MITRLQHISDQEGLDTAVGTTLDLCLSPWDLQTQLQYVRIVHSVFGLSDPLPMEIEFNIHLVKRRPFPKRYWRWYKVSFKRLGQFIRQII
ncbi:hypothetical protein EYZ11_008727 [Aspergillus tanneri]|uniref:Uncharacterized protein n=1 Tax=Aspergillus tanneri TaxID=1220188 RepID=A0A4S3JA28_9EURO|nr:hypothetical protein EYZ11_008727 [Aspergillus tanneri]